MCTWILLCFRTFLIITGGITVIFGSLLGHRIWSNLRKRREKKEMQRRLDESRRLRRQNVRDNDLPENMRCVVCQESPREVILLPCGHLCLCEDCSAKLSSNCPVCRSQISNRAAAFLS